MPLRICCGCGRGNEHGPQIKTCWEGEETVTRFTPEPYLPRLPGLFMAG
ncbi:MAG: hypothetical protein MZV49_11055 [Rhodopseudomonas palustris]|nr:hypothetical protein [Rhodopseudomonas palustris]